MSISGLQFVRASVLHCTDNPDKVGKQHSVVYIPDAYLIINDGLILDCVAADKYTVPEHARLIDLSSKLLIPGFVDTHIHYPQVDIIAAYGTQLLEWLERYTFPVEARFSEEEHAIDTARFFVNELLRNGTTTALVFGTVHPESVNAFFKVAQTHKLRMICGKVMMDRHAPAHLLDTAQSSYEQTRHLIHDWHGKDRLGYAVTPRFAPTSSPEQLTMATRLLNENPDVYLHTHMAENADECRWVASLFPGTEDYLAVYEKFDLVRKRSVFAHCIHLSESAWKRLARAEASVAHCPCSNLALGSGLFDLRAIQKHNVRCGLGTDIGGGDSFSILRNANEAYKIQQLQKHTLPPEQAFYLATLGGAKALDLDNHIGNFQSGKEADFLVVDLEATPLMARRTANQTHWSERLFSMLMLGDDRCIEQTWIMGEPWVEQ